MDVLGWEYRVAASTISLSQIGFLGIAVALLGRNTAVGTGLAALLFGALLTGTSQRNLDPSIFKPELASNLTLLIQGLVVLFVGADLLILYAWNARKKLRRETVASRRATGACVVSGLAVASRPVTRLTTPHAIGVLGIALGLVACWLDAAADPRARARLARDLRDPGPRRGDHVDHPRRRPGRLGRRGHGASSA